MHICPTCHGSREVKKCSRCLGAGYVSDLVMKKIEDGLEHKHQRVLHGLTISQAAALEGVSVATISKRENGML